MITRPMLIFLTMIFIVGVIHPLRYLRLTCFFVTEPPGLLLQKTFNQPFIKSVGTRPWLWHLTIIPVGSYSFNTVLRFMITYDGNFIPSADSDMIIVIYFFFPFSEAFMITDFVPYFNKVTE